MDCLEIARLLLTRCFRYCDHKAPTGLILNRMNSVHILFSFKINFNIIILSTPSKWSLHIFWPQHLDISHAYNAHYVFRLSILITLWLEPAYVVSIIQAVHKIPLNKRRSCLTQIRSTYKAPFVLASGYFFTESTSFLQFHSEYSYLCKLSLIIN
jgi:hypothetical protein